MIAEVNINENKTYDFKGNYGNFSLEVKDGQYHAVMFIVLIMIVKKWVG